MLYGIARNKEIHIVAADTRTEFDDCTKILDDMSVEYHVEDMTITASRPGFLLPPIIITSGRISPDSVKLLEVDDAMSRHSDMVLGVNRIDPVDEIYNMYNDLVKERDQTLVHNTIPMIREQICPTGAPLDLRFSAYCDPVQGTVAIISTLDALDHYAHPLHLEFSPDYRMGGLLDLPVGFGEEIAPGCFKFQGSPLAARAALIAMGMTESERLSIFTTHHFSVNPMASSLEETAYALGMTLPCDCSDFLFATKPHPNKASTYVSIIPLDYWGRHHRLPSGIFLSPIITELLDIGIREISPGVFETLGASKDVSAMLVALGMTNHSGVYNALKRYVTVIAVNKTLPSPIPSTPLAAPDYEKWGAIEPDERMKQLPNSAISFCMLVNSSLECCVFFTSTCGFTLGGKLDDHDLMLEERLPHDIERVGQNVFTMSGMLPEQRSSFLARLGFVDNYDLLLHVNIELFSGTLLDEIAFDPTL